MYQQLMRQSAGSVLFFIHGCSQKLCQKCLEPKYEFFYFVYVDLKIENVFVTSSGAGIKELHNYVPDLLFHECD